MKIFRTIGVAAALSAFTCVSVALAAELTVKSTPALACNGSVCMHKQSLYLADYDWQWIKSVSTNNHQALFASKAPPKLETPPCNCVPGYRCACEHYVALYLSDFDWQRIKIISDQNKQMLMTSKPPSK